MKITPQQLNNWWVNIQLPFFQPDMDENYDLWLTTDNINLGILADSINAFLNGCEEVFPESYNGEAMTPSFRCGKPAILRWNGLVLCDLCFTCYLQEPDARDAIEFCQDCGTEHGPKDECCNCCERDEASLGKEHVATLDRTHTCAHVEIDTYCGAPATQVKGGLYFCDDHIEVGVGWEPDEVRTGHTEPCCICGQTMIEWEDANSKFLLDVEGRYHVTDGSCAVPEDWDFCDDCGTTHGPDDECADGGPSHLPSRSE